MKIIYLIFLLVCFSSLTTCARLKSKKLSSSCTTKVQGSSILWAFKNLLGVSANIYQGFSLEEQKKAEQNHLKRLENISAFFAGSFDEMCSRASMSEILNNQIYQKFKFEIWRVELAGKQVLTTALFDSQTSGLSAEEIGLVNSSANSMWEQISSIKESMKPLIHASRAAVDSVCYFKQDLAVELKESALRRISEIKEEIKELSFFVKMLINPSEYKEKWFGSLKESIQNVKESAESKINLKSRLIAVTQVILSGLGINKELLNSGIEAIRTTFNRISGKEDVSLSQLLSKQAKFLKEIYLVFETMIDIPKPFKKAIKVLLESISVIDKKAIIDKILPFIEIIAKEFTENETNLMKIMNKLKEIVQNTAGDQLQNENSPIETQLETLVGTLKLPKDQLTFMKLLVNKITTTNKKASGKYWNTFELSLSLVKIIAKQINSPKVSKSLGFAIEMAEVALLFKNKDPKEVFKTLLIDFGNKIKNMLIEKIKDELKNALAKVAGKIIKPLTDIYNSISKIYVAHYQLINTKKNINQSERQLQNMFSNAKNANSVTVTALNFDSISTYKNLKEGTKLLFSFKRAQPGKIKANEHCANSFLDCFNLIGENALDSLKRADKLYCAKDIFLESNQDWEEALLSSGFEKSNKHHLYYNFIYTTNDSEILDLYFTDEKEEEAKKAWIEKRKVPDSDQIEQELVLKEFTVGGKKAYTINIKSEKLDSLPSLRELFCKNFILKFKKKRSLKRSNSFEAKDKKPLLPFLSYNKDQLEHILIREMCSLIDRSLSSFTSKQLKAIEAKDKEIIDKYSTSSDKEIEKVSISELTDQIQIDNNFSLTRLDLALIARGKVPDISNLKPSSEKQEIIFHEPESFSEGLFFSYINSKEPACLLAKELVTKNRLYTVHSKPSVKPDNRKGTEKERNDLNLLKENVGIWKENSLRGRQIGNKIKVDEFLENGMSSLVGSNVIHYYHRRTTENKDFNLRECKYSIQFVSLNIAKDQPFKYKLTFGERKIIQSGNKSITNIVKVPVIEYEPVSENSKERGFKPEIQFMITTKSPNLSKQEKEALRLARNGALLKAANYGWTRLMKNGRLRFSISQAEFIFLNTQSSELELDVLVRPLPLKTEEDPKELCTSITKKVKLY